MMLNLTLTVVLLIVDLNVDQRECECLNSVTLLSVNSNLTK